MKLRVLFLSIILALLSTSAPLRAAGSDSIPATQSVGLVLSGGGAKGIAHIGVIQALEDNNIPIDYIAGTSMGAIVGSLYACGYTPAEMMAIINSESFADWSTGTIDKKLTYYFLQDDPLPTMINLNLGDSDSTLLSSVLPSSLINPLPMNFAFMELYAPYTAQCRGNFDRLFVPFRCVSSDMTNKRRVVSSSGSLSDAVRASMSFPLVFKPIERDGALLYDGGIYDNFPVDVMRDSFAPQIMIGVDVSSTDTSSDSPNMMSQLETMIIQHSDCSLPADQGIKLRIHLEEFGLLDFPKAAQIYRIGYDHAMAMIDSIKGRIHARIPAEARSLRRNVFKSQTPYLRFDSVHTSGGSEAVNNYVTSLFTRNRPDTISLDRARDAYYRAITPGKFRNLEPTALYSDSTGLFTLNLQSTLRKNYQLGIGGFLTTSTNSMLFLSGGYKTLSYNSLDLRLSAWVGQSYLAAEASAHIRLLRAVPSSLQLRLVASREKSFGRDRLFFQTTDPTALTHTEYFARLEYGVASGRHAKTIASVGYGHTADKLYLRPMLLGDGHDDMHQNMAEARLHYEYNSINNHWNPTSGALYQATLTGALGQAYFDGSPASEGGGYYRTHRSWAQAELLARNFFDLSRHFSLGTEASLLYSTRKLLPTYSAAICYAPAFTPSAAFSNLFTPDFRANSFAYLGVMPVWKLSSMMQLRTRADIFAPLRPILPAPDGAARYGKWLSRADFFGELRGVVTLPFADISAYLHYSTANGSKWNFGLTFGYFLQAPRFLR